MRDLCLKFGLYILSLKASRIPSKIVDIYRVLDEVDDDFDVLEGAIFKILLEYVLLNQPNTNRRVIIGPTTDPRPIVYNWGSFFGNSVEIC